jgi:Fe-S-cluster containining protein
MRGAAPAAGAAIIDAHAPPPPTAFAPSRTTIAAGDFGAWLQRMFAVLRGAAIADVPCGTCTGCCTSSYHLLIRQADRPAVAALGERWLLEAPGLEQGEALLGFHANGHCPALAPEGCTIYAQRPLTCRDYDCRVFAAAGIDAGGADKAVINERVRAWRFAHASDADAAMHAAIRAAACFIREQGAAFPGGRAPTSPTGIAVLALKAYPVFLEPAQTGRTRAEIVHAMIEASRRFDAGTMP